MFFSSFLWVTTIKINGEKYINESAIADQVKPEIDGKIWKIINRNNLFLANGKKIEKKLTEKFRQIRSVEIVKKFPNELDVRVIEREPTVLFQATNGWFLLDENSIAYDTADPEATELQKYELARFSDGDGKTVNLGETVLNQAYQNYLLGISNGMKEDIKIEIEKDFQTPSLISDDIRAKTKEGWGIYFNENIPLNKEMKMLNIVLDKEITESQRLDLDYIDLRIDNKVYYKFKDGTPEETARLAETAAEQAATGAAINPAPAATSSDNANKKKK